VEAQSQFSFVDQLKFDASGLITAIVQDVETHQVLMVAYMNREAVIRTFETGRTCFWSRSRQKLWVKGETSGHTQQVQAIYLDCDGDCLLIAVTQEGAACHEGYRSCFFRKVTPEGNVKVAAEKVFDPQKVYMTG